MSVLQTPRVNFVGTISWSPGLANNNRDVFDAAKAEVILPAGVSVESFPTFLIHSMQDFGIWNLYGSHDATFEHYEDESQADDNTRVVGGRIGTRLVETDPLLGKRVRLNGKLVDLDPAAVWNSQIFFDRFSLGDAQVGFTARRHRTMHSRWINFRRNLEQLDIAGSAGVVWQTVFPKSHIQYRGVEQSPLLKALQDAPNADGLMLRFATYRTLYFQNGIYNDAEHRPRDLAQLEQLHREGKYFENPAYSRVVGSVGLWTNDEPETWPGGRYLVPANPLPPLAVGGRPFALGPAVVEIAGSTMALDFLHAIPEMNGDLEKPNLGELIVGVSFEGNFLQLGTISPSQYGTQAYERDAGIITVPIQLTAIASSMLKNGSIEVRATAGSQTVTVLAEQTRVVLADQRDAYTTMGDTFRQDIRVLERGEAPPAPTSVAIGKYVGLTKNPDPNVVVQVDEAGEVAVELDTSVVGPADFGMVAFDSADETPPELPQRIDITAGQFISVRVLVSDDDLESNTSDDQLTWDFIYNAVLRNWDLMNPIMNLRGLPLGDENVMRDLAADIVDVVSEMEHESTRYMPITRDLSRGKRQLLQRWADRQA